MQDVARSDTYRSNRLYILVLYLYQMVSEENKVVAVTATTALVLLVGLSAYTDLSSRVVAGVVFVVGILLPQVYLNYGRA